jgi:hypothetical protein
MRIVQQAVSEMTELFNQQAKNEKEVEERLELEARYCIAKVLHKYGFMRISRALTHVVSNMKEYHKEIVK